MNISLNGGWIVPVALCLTQLGCGAPTPEDEVQQSGSFAFSVGAPIDDAAITAIVETDSAQDTLASAQFNHNLLRLKSMFPDVMGDPEQEASIRREIVKQFAIDRIILAAARAEGISIEPNDIQARLDKFRASFESDEAYENELETYQQSEVELREQYEIGLTRDALGIVITSRLQPPADADIDEFRQSLAERVLVQHILFGVEQTASTHEIAAVKLLAIAVLDSIRNDVEFKKLAERHSTDRGTAMVGGELPWFRRGEMVQEFEQAAFALRGTGEVSPDPVETSYGYHLIRMIDRATDEPVSMDSANVLLTKERAREAEKALMIALQSEATVRVNPNYVEDF